MVEQEMRSYLSSVHTSATEYYLKVATGDAEMPYGVVFKIDPGRDYTHTRSGIYINSATLQCSCFGSTYYQAKVMAQEVIEQMEVWSDFEAEVQAVFLLGEMDLFEEDKKTFHIPLDFIVWHTF